MENSTVVEAIRYLMDTHGISAAELSKGTGIATSTMYSMLEKKSNVVNLDHLVKIAEQFHVDLNIFAGVEKYKPPLELDDNERMLLSAYRNLNRRGKTRLIEYAEELCYNKRYTGENEGEKA